MQPVPVGYPIEKLSGPLIVAYLLHWGLFGTLSVQLYLYYLAFPNDRKFTKCLVYGVYVIEFVQTMIFTHDAFATFGYGFGDIEALTGMYFNWFTVPIMSAVSAFIGQAFYAYRIFILSKSLIVPIFVICVSLTSLVAGIITGVWCFPADNVIELNSPRMSVAVGILCGAAALCDITIAICMTYYLMRRNTDFRRTQMLVTKLIRLTVETGSVTGMQCTIHRRREDNIIYVQLSSLCSVLSFFFAFPHQTFYGTPTLIVAKLYANNVYMVLNSRIRIIGGRDTYTSSADMSITTTMMRDMTQSTEGTPPTDRFQGRVSVIAITPEIFIDDHEMGKERMCRMAAVSACP
ncbi:hypothetical protein EDD18DRAFT_1464990 [Armillaria luteobubalina]|uniref:DUF6534 domain-containing protein n=1 Tax=Armillaria luteobubalina TaxID=153913 RepID=A0AA39TKM4_9AGAR|nr:hypothetical protein EDD18DRAFT_1464990 [Armillaria luteobubalina]